MKSIAALLLTIILIFTCKTIDAQENPFMLMAEKKYADYSKELFDEYIKFFELDTLEARKVIRQIEAVADKTGSMEWKLQVLYSECELLDLKRNLYGKDLFPVEQSLEMEMKLLEKAEKENVIPIELVARQKVINYYWNYLKKYELAFELYTIQEKRLKEVSSDDVPRKSDYFLHIANAHLEFKDYSQAIFYFNIVLEEKDNFHTSYSKQHARNGLGLSYRYGYNDLDRSDSYFLLMIQPENMPQPEDEYYRDVWTGIAEGNLGYNLFLRKEYDKAIPLLKNSLEKMLKHGDYGFSIGTAINLANIYLQKGNISGSKHYINLAQDYYAKIPREGSLSRIYETLCRYYAATKNVNLNMAYLDSLLAENKKYEEQFSALQMMRVKQRQHISEQKIKEEQLNIEKLKSDGYKRSLVIALIALLLIGGVLLFLWVIYRKKQAAYRELVRKSQEWAQVNPVHPANDKPDLSIKSDDPIESGEQEKQNGLPDEVDLLIMQDIEKLMLEDKLYRDTSLSVDTLAHKLNAKRYYISMAINRCMNKSFNTFINEYRIKEAIQLLSKNENNSFKIDAVAFDVGFNDRKSFHRVFKKMTGLSPTEFKNNLVA